MKHPRKFRNFLSYMDAPLRTFSFTETKDIVQAIIQMAADKCKERYSNNADEILINAEKDI